MWALRRASIPIRNQVLGIGASYTCLKLDALTACNDTKFGVATALVSSNSFLLSNCFYHTSHIPSGHGVDRRSLSSQACATNSGEEVDLEDGFSELDLEDGFSEHDVEDGFSELESTPATSSLQKNDADDEAEDLLITDQELSDDDIDNHGVAELSQSDKSLSETAIDMDEQKASNRMASSALSLALTSSLGLPVHNTLDKWVKEGKNLSRPVISSAISILRKRKLYGRALQLFEWLEANKQLDLTERDYASQVDLIAMVHGLQNAENYVEKVPKPFRGEKIYQTLLANCVIANNVGKAEKVFNKMTSLGFPVSAFCCNHLILLYKRRDKKKIADILVLMEKEDVKPSLFTYKLLIDVKGQSKDIRGMDQIVETMRADGIEPDIRTQAIIAKHYSSNGLKEKAIAILKEMEGNDLKAKRWVCRFLLPLYGEMKMPNEVERVWNVCKSDPQAAECISAIAAWGKVNNIIEAEAVFETMLKTWKRLSTKQYHMMLKVYRDHKMITKGENLVKRMADNGCHIDPLTWNSLVMLYVETGEVSKADSILQKAVQKKKMKPLLCSFMIVLDQYAKRGDVHNSEKIFHRIQEAGYIPRTHQFHSLLQAYVNANAPAYGMRDRIKATNTNLNKTILMMLEQVDAFKRTTISDLLD